MNVNSRVAWISIALVAATIIAYAPARYCSFVNFDDTDYVSGNNIVKSGLTIKGVVWAFTTRYAANWHPLTWLSHMLDIQLFGLNPGPEHLTNVFFHLGSTLALFWALFQMTELPAPSAIVAAFFAVHPLHVESVAWISERKDVLSTFFCMLTVCVYIQYVRRTQRGLYWAVLGLFAAGLMAKPMLVTLPFVLLLFDFWPLGRWSFSNPTVLPKLLVEKLPLLIMSLISSAVTVVAQQGALVGLDRVPIVDRFPNAFVAYFMYVKKLLWPSDLAVLYPLPITPPGWWIFAALGIAFISIFAVWIAQRRPYVFVGWFWYLGTLVPVIGLVQVGKQAYADRYSYVPSIGLLLILVFGCYDLVHRIPAAKTAAVAFASLAIFGCVDLTRQQLGYWLTSETLWTHALAVTSSNASAHVNVGSYLEKEGKLTEAISHYREALRLEPDFGIAQSHLGSALEKTGQLDEAIYHYDKAIQNGSEPAEWDFNLGNALAKAGKVDRLDDAVRYLTRALQVKPDFPEARNALGICYLTKGQLEKAVSEFSEATRLKPDYASAHNNLATTLGELGRTEQAIHEFSEAVRLDPNYVDAHDNLGILFARAGRIPDAIAHFTTALRLNSNDEVAKNWIDKLGTSGHLPERN
jgi:tetratricopeptide (TPR) repeat protein